MSSVQNLNLLLMKVDDYDSVGIDPKIFLPQQKTKQLELNNMLTL